LEGEKVPKESKESKETKALIGDIEVHLKKYPNSFDAIRQAVIDINEKIKTGK
jgi:hypothetical protein